MGNLLRRTALLRNPGPQGYRGGGTALFRRFSPLAVPGLALLLEADQISGVTDTDPLATWTDRTAFGHSATQATEGNRPVYETGVQNGLPGIHFTAASSHFMTFGNPATFQFGETWTAVFVWQTVAATRQTLFGHSNTVNAVSFEALAAANARHAVIPGQFLVSTIGADDGTTAEVVAYRRFSTALNDAAISINGVALATTAVSPFSSAGNGTKELGRRAAASQHLDGYLFAAAIWPQRALAKVELDRVSAYFMQRWGIA